MKNERAPGADAPQSSYLKRLFYWKYRESISRLFGFSFKFGPVIFFLNRHPSPSSFYFLPLFLASHPRLSLISRSNFKHSIVSFSCLLNFSFLYDISGRWNRRFSIWFSNVERYLRKIWALIFIVQFRPGVTRIFFSLVATFGLIVATPTRPKWIIRCIIRFSIWTHQHNLLSSYIH